MRALNALALLPLLLGEGGVEGGATADRLCPRALTLTLPQREREQDVEAERC